MRLLWTFNPVGSSMSVLWTFNTEHNTTFFLSPTKAKRDQLQLQTQKVEETKNICPNSSSRRLDLKKGSMQCWTVCARWPDNKICMWNKLVNTQYGEAKSKRRSTPFTMTSEKQSVKINLWSKNIHYGLEWFGQKTTELWPWCPLYFLEQQAMTRKKVSAESHEHILLAAFRSCFDSTLAVEWTQTIWRRVQFQGEQSLPPRR